MVIKQRSAAFKKSKEWKLRVKQAIGFPNFGIEVWRPILEDLGKCEIHHTDEVYQKCHKFVQNARSRLKKKFK